MKKQIIKTGRDANFFALLVMNHEDKVWLKYFRFDTEKGIDEITSDEGRYKDVVMDLYQNAVAWCETKKGIGNFTMWNY